MVKLEQGKHNKKLNKDKKQLAFCSLRSLILANNFLPVNWALYFKERLVAISRLAKVIFLILIIGIFLTFLKFSENHSNQLQANCEKIEKIARNKVAVGHLDSWVYEHVIDKGYHFVSGMHGRISGSKGEDYVDIKPLPKEKITEIEINYFRLSVDKIDGDFTANITNTNVGQIDFGRGRDQVIILKNGAQLKSYRGHDESSGHLLKINDSLFAYCADAKFEI